MSGCEMPKRKCTGANCPMQAGYVVPETCPEPEKCRYATFPQTNGDKIRAMSDSEYADWLCDHVLCGDCPVYEKCGKEIRNYGRAESVEDCFNQLLNWLRSPVEESEK